MGAAGPRSLDAIGRLADGWLPSLGRFTPEPWAERLRALSDDLGIDTGIVWPEGGDPDEQVARLAAEVMPLIA